MYVHKYLSNKTVCIERPPSPEGVSVILSAGSGQSQSSFTFTDKSLGQCVLRITSSTNGNTTFLTYIVIPIPLVVTFLRQVLRY